MMNFYGEINPQTLVFGPKSLYSLPQCDELRRVVMSDTKRDLLTVFLGASVLVFPVLIAAF